MQNKNDIKLHSIEGRLTLHCIIMEFSTKVVKMQTSASVTGRRLNRIVHINAT